MKINSLLIASIFLSALFMADSIAQKGTEFPDVKKADDKSLRSDSVKCKNFNKEKYALENRIMQACAAAGDIDSCIKIKKINYPNYFSPGLMYENCDGLDLRKRFNAAIRGEYVSSKGEKYVSPAVDPINSEPDAFKSYYGFDKPTDPEEIKRRLKL
jgi:hypothetical protein